tara:strand:- start:1015 stop:1308 length:294 start_codon:yes stop_codon:yes gene_type:complete
VTKYKKISFVGIPSPIKYKSKKYVLEKLYEKAKRNPFLMDKTYEEYLDFVRTEIELLTLEEPKDKTEESLYNKLKEIGWLKEIPVLVFTFLGIKNIT